MKARLQELLNKPSAKVLVVGDVMLDKYSWGNSTRNSPEAPVPVVDITAEETRPGGAANVASNLVALGAQVAVLGVVGNDPEGEELLGHFTALGIKTDWVQKDPSRPTTCKTRVISPDGHLMRLDREVLADCTALNLPSVEALKDFDAVLLQDYNKGVLNSATIAQLMAAASEAGIPVTVDPKFENFKAYAGASLFKPNLKELNNAFGWELNPEKDQVLSKMEQARTALNVERLLLTLSQHGIALCGPGVTKLWPADFAEITDVSGAGDTVIAVATIGLIAGWTNEEIATISSYCGGWTCQFPGVKTPDLEAMINDLGA